MRRVLFTALLTAALAATVAVRPVAAGDSGVTVATGSVTLVGSQFGAPMGSHRTFSFTVVQLPNGEITGQAEIINFAGLSAHLAVNCFSVSGNQAIIGGTTMASSNPDAIGVEGVFAIQDNPDFISLLVSNFEEPVTCENFLSETGVSDITEALDEFGIAVESGNVMIRHAN